MYAVRNLPGTDEENDSMVIYASQSTPMKCSMVLSVEESVNVANNIGTGGRR